MMNIQKIKKLRTLFLIQLIILISAGYISNFDASRVNEFEENLQDYSSKNTLKNAGFWILTPLVIDDDGGGDYTWLEASSEDWCSGSGTYHDPYVLENLDIDGLGSTSCITIRDSTKYVILNNNTLYNCGTGTYSAGIYLRNTENVKIVGCNISYNNKHGIDLDQNCYNNTIQGNIFLNNSNYAIRVSSCDGNRFLNNNMTNNLVGINLGNCIGNNITGNYVSNSEQMGIHIKQSSSDNLVFNNSFINNSPNGIDDSSNNSWDSGSLGNYWSDYVGVDADDDGIGDTPYLISGTAGSQDHYPLLDDGFNGAPIYIDNLATGIAAHNWTWASGQIWCTGSGLYEDPYIISDLNIDASGFSYGIKVENSEVYFKVENCTISHSDGYGITLEHVNNSYLFENNCSLNNDGITMTSCYNNTLEMNTASQNVFCGICFVDSNNNTLLHNILKDNNYAIQLVGYNNTLLGNVMENCGLMVNVYGNLDEVSSNTADVTNTVNGKTLYYYTNENALEESDFLNAGQVILVNCQDFEVNDLELIGGTLGLSVFFSDNISIYRTNSSDNTWGGIFLSNTNDIIITDSHVSNNQFGGITTLNCLNSIIYNNEIVQNNPNAFDAGINNHWDNGTIGNFWGDYIGADANDDGIGDNPYIIGGTPGNQDQFPICEDGDDESPDIYVNSPLGGSIFEQDAPLFNLTLYDYYSVDMAWYTINEITPQVFFIPVIGENIVSLNQTAWELLPEGSIIIRFYVNDSAGHTNNVAITIIKDISEPTNPPEIPFGNFYLIFLLLGVVSLTLITHKKKL